MKSGKWIRGVLWVLYGLLALGVVGVWFHTSESQPTVLGKYSTMYFLAACVATVFGITAGFIAYFLVSEQRISLRSGRTITVPTRFKILAVAALALVLVVSAEVVLTRRKAGGPRADLRGFHPYLQVAPIPGQKDNIGNDARINRWGLRGEEIAKQKPAKTYRIFALGGSTVYCAEVEFEQTWVRLLEKHLRQQYPDVIIEVQNAAYPWHTSQHSLIKFLTKVQDFDPDLIIVYHGINDLLRGFSPPMLARGEYQPDYGHYDGPVAKMVRFYGADRGRFHLHVVDEATSFVARQWFSDLRGRIPEPKVEEKAITEWKSLPSFTRNLRNLTRIARSQNIEVVLCSQPYLHKEDMSPEEQSKWRQYLQDIGDRYESPDIPSMARGMNTFNRTSRDIAEEHRVAFVDLEQMVPKTVEHFVDGYHYTAQGNRLIADALREAVIRNGFVPKKFPRSSR